MQFDEDSVLWDGKVTKIDAGEEELKDVNPYSSNPDHHWSRISGKSDKQVIELQYCNYFESFHSGLNFFVESDLGEIFEDKIRYQIEKSDIFSVSKTFIESKFLFIGSNSSSTTNNLWPV